MSYGIAYSNGTVYSQLRKHSLVYFSEHQKNNSFVMWGSYNDLMMHSFTVLDKHIPPESFKVLTNNDYSIALPTQYCLKEPTNGFWGADYDCKCSSNCYQCVHSSLNCFSCTPNSNFVISQNTCLCRHSYYYDTQKDKCFKCSPLCSECVGNGNCSHCINDSSIVIINNQCKCREGYYLNATLNKCIHCGALCLSCEPENCTKCKNDDYIVQNVNQCACKIPYYYDAVTNDCKTCEPGYFFDGIGCTQCSYFCKQCTSNHSCSKCVGPNVALINEQCKCEKGYYLNREALRCEKCDLLCSDCIQRADDCCECKPIAHVWHNKMENTCRCLLGYTYNNESKVCDENATLTAMSSAYIKVYTVGLTLLCLALVGVGIVLIARIRKFRIRDFECETNTVNKLECV